MGANYGKGARGKATRLHSQVVRERAGNRCENCQRAKGDINPDTGKEVKSIQCAHIISRHMTATRTDETNAFCLCASCHWYFGKWPLEFAAFVFDKVGVDRYAALKAKAEAGKGKPVDWDAEVERLARILDETTSSSGMSG